MQIFSHILLKIITKYKKITRRLLAIGKENRQQFLYLGDSPGSEHPLSFIWSINPKYITSWILQGETMLFLWDRLISARPTNILELGSGFSTLMFARYAEISMKRYGKKFQIITLEHDEAWLDIVNVLLTQHNLDDYVNIILCPINTISVDGFTGESYDLQDLPKLKIDFVLIDGPPFKVGRILTLPSLIAGLSNSATIFLDDAQRYSERDAIKMWRKRYSSKIEFKGYTPVGTGVGEIERV